MSTLKTEAASVRVEQHFTVALKTTVGNEMRRLADLVKVIVVKDCRAQDYLLGVMHSKTPSTAKREKTL
jgi:hypothetical protein